MKSRNNDLIKKIGILIAFLILGLLFNSTILASDNLCINYQLWGTPTIDGEVESDPDWNEATQVNLPNGGIPGGSLGARYLMTRDNSFIYLAVEVLLGAPSANDVVVIAFSTDNDPAHDWLIHIFPFNSSDTVPADGKPYDVSYWRNSTTWTPGGGMSSEDDAPDIWLRSNTRISVDSETDEWFLEMKIPWEKDISNAHSNDKIYFPEMHSTFKLYFNILDTRNLGVPQYVQAPWPTDAEMVSNNQCEEDIDYCKIQYNTPINNMGTVSLFARPVCSGVFLDMQNIGVDNDNNIDYFLPGDCPSPDDPDAPSGPSNEFWAKPFNDMNIDAEGVKVRFWIANYGINYNEENWTEIPNKENQGVSNPETILKNMGNSPRLTYTWTLTKQQACQAANEFTQLQCIKAKLESSNQNVRFKKSGDFQNVQYFQASKIRRNVAISALGYGSPPVGRNKHEFLIAVDTKVQKYEREGDYYKTIGGKLSLPAVQPRTITADPGTKESVTRLDRIKMRWDTIPIPASIVKKGLSEAMTTIFRGYRNTGRYILIKGKKYEYAEYTGGCGFIGMHEKATKKWTIKFPSDALKKTEMDDLYTIKIAQDQEYKLNTTIDAREPNFLRDLFEWVPRLLNNFRSNPKIIRDYKVVKSDARYPR